MLMLRNGGKRQEDVHTCGSTGERVCVYLYPLSKNAHGRDESKAQHRRSEAGVSLRAHRWLTKPRSKFPRIFTPYSAGTIGKHGADRGVIFDPLLRL